MKTLISRKSAFVILAILRIANLGWSQQLVITRQPAHQPVSLGANVTFQVGVTGSPPLSYQWRRSGNDVSDATNSSLALLNVQDTNAGNYTVVVTNSSGSVTSSVARLDILPAFSKSTIDIVGAGSAWIDYDGDGYLDLVAASSIAPSGSLAFTNSLFRNNRDGTFSPIDSPPITTDMGYSLSVAWGDFDNDGLPDVLFGNAFGPTPTVTNLFYHNLGNGSFEGISGGQLGNEAGNFTATWADYDRDGFIDIFLANAGGRQDLFRNLGDGTFIPATGTGIAPSQPAGGNDFNGVTWADYDDDGYPDLFIFGGGGHNSLYHSNGKGSFDPVNQPPFTTDSGEASIGAAWGDYDNDGFLDLYIVNGNFDSVQRQNYLYHNNGNGTFTKVVIGTIATDYGSGTTAAWEDFDNDGNLDLFVSQHTGQSGTARNNVLYHNNGDGTFTRLAAHDLIADAGYFDSAAWGDIENDGFPDLFVTGEAPSLLYHNQGNSNAWITFKLVGSVSNRSAIGAKVRVKATIRGNTYWQMREISNGDGLAGNNLRAHFGLGDATEADTVRIEWPSGTPQEFHHVAAKQILTITEPARLQATITNGVTQFVIKGGRNLQYEVDSSTDLLNWSQVGTVKITNVDGTAVITNPNPNAPDRLFYRAELH
jgi:hypothetical protein